MARAVARAGAGAAVASCRTSARDLFRASLARCQFRACCLSRLSRAPSVSLLNFAVSLFFARHVYVLRAVVF